MNEKIEPTTEKPLPMSEEQNCIYECIENGKNVIGDACAGSGKSTTILSIADKMPNKRFIQLTYNSLLCSDVREKIELYQLENINVYTYHSLVVRYYNPKGYTDTVIRRVLFQKTQPVCPIPAFDILVLDET